MRRLQVDLNPKITTEGFLKNGNNKIQGNPCSIFFPENAWALTLTKTTGLINMSLLVLFVRFGGDPGVVCLNDQAIKA